MPLKVNKVSRLLRPIRSRVLRAEEVVEPHLEQRCQRRVRRDMPANSGILLVLPVHHRHCVPADQRLHPLLHRPIARVRHLVMLRNRIQIRRRQLARHRYAGLTRPRPQRLNHLRALFPIRRNHVVERLNPLRNLGGKIRLHGLVNLCRRHRSPPRSSHQPQPRRHSPTAPNRIAYNDISTEPHSSPAPLMIRALSRREHLQRPRLQPVFPPAPFSSSSTRQPLIT